MCWAWVGCVELILFYLHKVLAHFLNVNCKLLFSYFMKNLYHLIDISFIMTIKIIPKKPIIATIAATILLGTILVISNTLTNDVLAQTLPSSPCPASGQVEHWDKIIFLVEDDPSKTIDEKFLKTPLDLKIRDPPEKVVFLIEEVRNAVADEFELDAAKASALKLEIIDVKYQTVTCGVTGPQGERVITYSGAETNPGGTGTFLGTVNNGAETFIGCTSGQCVSFTSMHTIPDGATLTKLECFFKDPDTGSNIFCRLQRGQTTGLGFNISTLLGTSVTSPNVQSLSDTFTHVVDRSANNYHIVWQMDPSCTTCRIIAVQVTYTE